MRLTKSLFNLVVIHLLNLNSVCMSFVGAKVSLVVPAFNETRDVLALSLGSIAAQSFSNFECLVIDESTDPESISACHDFCVQDKRFRYVHPEMRLGLAASLNLGISLAQGDLIARFDSDDVCMPSRLALQVAFMHTHPDVDVVGGGLEIISADGKTIAFRDFPLDHATIERRFQTMTPIAHPTVMVRKSVFLEHGGYDPTFLFAEDLELWLRLLNRGVRFANMKEVLVRYRQQNTCRNPIHWRYNLRARRRNFSIRQLPMRVLGICGMSVWGILPSGVQEHLYYSFLLRTK